MFNFLFKKKSDSVVESIEEDIDEITDWDRSIQKENNVNVLLEQKLERIEKQAFVVQPTLHGFAQDIGLKRNTFGLSGSQANPLVLEWFASQGFIGYQACSIIAQHWLVYKACTMSSEDAVRNGYKIIANNGEKLSPSVVDAIRDLDQQYEIDKQLVKFRTRSKIFGIRIAFFKIKSKDKKYYEKPFNIDGITKDSYKGIVQVDPYWATPQLDGDAAANPSSTNFYEPTYWLINGRLYHHSHLIIDRYAEVTDILKPTYLYGGIPLTQMIYERVYAAERVANEAPALTMSKRIFVLKTSAKKALAQMNLFVQRIMQFASFKDNYGIQPIDEHESIEKLDTSLTDLSEVIENQYQIVAAIAGIPETKLMSRELTGMSSEGKGDKNNYYDVVSNEQVHMNPLLKRHHEILIKSNIEPVFGKQPRITMTWNSAEDSTPTELSIINKTDSETAQIYYEMGVLDQEEIRIKLITDEDSGYHIDDREEKERVEYNNKVEEDTPIDGQLGSTYGYERGI